MPKRLTTVLLLLVLALAICNRGDSPATRRREMRAAEYEVLTAWIDAKFAGKERIGDGAFNLVILDTTESGDDHFPLDDNYRPILWEKMAASLREKDPALQQSALDAFRMMNAREAFLRRSLHSSIDYQVVTEAQLEPIFCYHCGSWPAYYHQFPGSQGLLTFSGVGISADGTQAIFYLSNVCEGLCGVGDYVVMEKHDGRWVIQQEIEMWVS